MGLILCADHTAAHPFYIEELGVHLFTDEELCYVIHEYPLLVMDDFLKEPLFEFLRDELQKETLAELLLRMRKEGASDDDLLAMILRDGDLYGDTEVGRYRGKLSSLRKLRPAEYLKRKADFTFGLKKYGKAISLYDRILAMPDDQVLTPEFRGAVLNNEGSAYANLFLLDKAYRAYDRAYGFLKDKEILKRIYYLSLLEPVLELKERYQSIAGDEANVEWDREYEKIRMEVKECDRLKDLEAMFSRDPVRRMKLASEQIEKWKQEYRNML